MLISFKKRFIFIANPKAASTSVERLLKTEAEIAIIRLAYGKHMPYKAIEKQFKFIFNKSGIPANAYFRFGIIRDPLDWVVSWYNYRTRDLLRQKNHPNSCYGISFEEFGKHLMSKGDRPKFAKVGFQNQMFKDAHNKLGVDYLIPLPRLAEDLHVICNALGIKRIPESKIIKTNVSPKLLSANDVSPTLATSLRDHFSVDAELFKKSIENGFGEISQIISNKLL